MSTRVSFKKLREWVNEWNEGHPEHEPFEVSAWNGYYHIGEKCSNMISEPTPGRAWEMFTMWKYGYSEGMDAQSRAIGKGLAKAMKGEE